MSLYLADLDRRSDLPVCPLLSVARCFAPSAVSCLLPAPFRRQYANSSLQSETSLFKGTASNRLDNFSLNQSKICHFSSFQTFCWTQHFKNASNPFHPTISVSSMVYLLSWNIVLISHSP